MLDYLWRRELLYAIILGIAIGLTILVPLIEFGLPLIDIQLPPFFPLQFPA